MNERIQKLAQEAGMYVDLNGNPWPKWMSAEECELSYAKFAELIVRECAEKCVYAVDRQEILAHFGVEE